MSYGAERFYGELRDLGYEVQEVSVDDVKFAVLRAYVIPVGRFSDRTIDLGLQATPDFPRTAPSAIHVKAEPQLYEAGDNVANVRNISVSALGTDFRYWSHNFGWTTERNARHLMSQIQGVFLRAG